MASKYYTFLQNGRCNMHLINGNMSTVAKDLILGLLANFHFHENYVSLVCFLYK